MWGDPDDYKPPNIVSDIAKGVPASTRLLLVAVILLAVLSALYLQYRGSISPLAHTSTRAPADVTYRMITTCDLTNNLSCEESVISGNEILLVIRNTNAWDITEGTVRLTSATGTCEFDGEQTLALLPSGSVQTLSFACADGTSYRGELTIGNAIAIEYMRDDIPLMQYASGMVIGTSIPN